MSNMAIGGGGDSGAMIQGMPKQGQEQFDIADTNEDGIVSMAEYLQSMPVDEVDSTKATERFSKLDTDGDGNISQQEQDKAMQVRQDHMSEMMSRMEGGTDSYGNGSNEQEASFDSFKTMLAAMAANTKDQGTSERLKAQLDKLTSEGYSKEGVKDSMELVNKVAPPINTTA
mgnify:CR=1 FL=1